MKSLTQRVLQVSVLGFVLIFVYTYCISITFGAGEYTPLVGIPGLSTSGTTSIPQFINQVYLLTISLGALFGVLKIAFAGVKYSLSDVVSSKQSAKEDIKGVLLGLAILLIPAIVLNEINPNLTKLDVLNGINKIELNKSSMQNSSLLTGGKSAVTYQKGTSVLINKYEPTCTASDGECPYEEDKEIDPKKIAADKASCLDKQGEFKQISGNRSTCVFKATTFDSNHMWDCSKSGAPGTVIDASNTQNCILIPQ